MLPLLGQPWGNCLRSFGVLNHFGQEVRVVPNGLLNIKGLDVGNLVEEVVADGRATELEVFTSFILHPL